MKTRKLLAMLVAVAMIVTMLPVVAFAADAAGVAVPDASRIYASDDEVDVEDTVTITVRLRDQSGGVATSIGDNQFYVWAERSEDRISQIDTIEEINGKKEADEDVTDWAQLGVEGDFNGSLVQLNDGAINEDGTVDVTYSSTFDGEVKFWFAIVEEWNDDEDDTPKKADYVTVVFEETEGYELELLNKKDLVDLEGEDRVKANGIDTHEVKIRVVDTRHGFPVKGEQVNFDTSSSRMRLNKDSAVTDSNGVVKVKASSERAGEYTLYAELDSDRKVKLNDGDGVDLEFFASSAYDVSVKKGDGAVVALDEDYTFEFEVFDIFGRVIKGSWDQDSVDNKDVEDYIEEITVPTCPDDAGIDDVDDFLKEDCVTWKPNANLKVAVDGGLLDEEGDYAIRVVLASGKHATANFEVKEQGEIVDMTIEYDPDYVKEDEESEEPEVKIIDVDGIEANATKKDLEFSVSSTRLATIDDDGVLKAKKDAEGVVTVTVVNTKHNVVATTEVRIGDVGAAGIEFDVPETLLVGEEYTIGMTVVDEDGKEYMDDAEFNAVVLSKPADAVVEVDVYDDELEVYSDTKGEVKLIVTAREEDEDGKYEAISSTLTLDFVTEPEKVVEGKVFLTIGANFGLVGGVAQDLDAPAFIEEGRTFVPVRFLAEAFGAEADWTPKDAAVETVFLTTDDMEISIGIGDEFLTVTRDGEAEVLTFDGAARIVDGRTFLPFRAIAEAFGAEVDYGPADGPVEWVSFE